MDDITLQLERHYAETGPALLAYFRRRSATATLADDLLQETFLRAWRQKDRMAAAVSVRAYLFGIARHVGADVARRTRASEPLDEEHPDVAKEIPDDRIEAMRTAIAALPETHREPLHLKLQEELSYAEIAEVLNVPIGTVRSRLHHAVLRLQQVLNPTVNPTTHTTTSNEA